MQASTKVENRTASAASGEKVAILSFTGDIASTSKDAIMDAYHELPPAVTRVLLDFTGTDYVNSSGIAIIIQLLLDANKKECKVGITGLKPHFVKVFTMVGVAKYAAISPNEATALALL
jgi:anti-sigma B factor antagonist